MAATLGAPGAPPPRSVFAEEPAGSIGATGNPGPPSLQVKRVEAAPVIDGNLDDAAWLGAGLQLTDWVSYNPLRGEKVPQRTDVFAAYDAKNLYFAFRCIDDEPEKIKSSVSRRDNQTQDDWVGVGVDAMGTAQVFYEMFVNPSGVQADAMDSLANGEDIGVDWVWDSAAQRTARGYDVEIRLPLQSIRFRGGDQVSMGVVFLRRISRTTMSVSWPAIPPGQWVHNFHATITLGELKQPRVLEAIPGLTWSFDQEKASPSAWGEGDSRPDAGVSVKYGLTSSVTLDATVNPDFSQVESDSFQMEVNQRYPVFYSEKRPFFMEGATMFNLSGTGFYSGLNMMTAVHTRNIADPVFGARLTGTAGQFSFGTLTALDQAPGKNYPADAPFADRFADKGKLFNIARATYNLGAGSYVGGIFTDTEFGGNFNRVAGGDVKIQLGQPHSVFGNLLYSASNDGVGRPASGVAGYVAYQYSTRRILFSPGIEHYDRDFRMDTAFYNRTGMTVLSVYSDLYFYPDAKKHPWLKKIAPHFYVRNGRDRVADGREQHYEVGVDVSTTRAGAFGVYAYVGREPWARQEFKTDGIEYFGQMQLYNWLRLTASGSDGYAIFYDEANPFQGKARTWSAGFTLQPSEKFSEQFEYYRQSFRHADTGRGVYRIYLVNTRSTYQFTRHVSARALVQYDSSQRRVLTDFLGAYEPIPGTVFYAGYGSLIERRGWDEGRREWTPYGGSYLTTRRGLFFKLSYLLRL
ncbi:MAG: carbohydrate binding family 9 domain-containing protein [Acidobacteriota bacterium]|nr:carbohydrate binding family 9 domain-containing protein [Acidobacteriota bacterium]